MARSKITSPTSSTEIRDAKREAEQAIRDANALDDPGAVYALLLRHAWSLPMKLVDALAAYDRAMKKIPTTETDKASRSRNKSIATVKLTRGKALVDCVREIAGKG